RCSVELLLHQVEVLPLDASRPRSAGFVGGDPRRPAPASRGRRYPGAGPDPVGRSPWPAYSDGGRIVAAPSQQLDAEFETGESGRTGEGRRKCGLLPKTWSSLNGNRTTGREPGDDPCESDPDRTGSRPSSATS